MDNLILDDFKVTRAVYVFFGSWVSLLQLTFDKAIYSPLEIKESINNILTELDWRTYDSAGQKALKKSKEIDKSNKDSSSKMYQRALKFNKASDKAYEKQTYGQSSKEKRQSINDYYDGKTKYNKDTHKWENK